MASYAQFGYSYPSASQVCHFYVEVYYLCDKRRSFDIKSNRL